MNVNLYEMAKHVAPHLAVIDGFVGMEGNGPVGGDMVNLRLAVASTDFVAADAVAARIMGFDVNQIGYLYYCGLKGLGTGNLEQMEIVGAKLEECVRKFKPHSAYRSQLEWQVAGVEKYL